MRSAIIREKSDLHEHDEGVRTRGDGLSGNADRESQVLGNEGRRGEQSNQGAHSVRPASNQHRGAQTKSTA